MDVYLSYTMFFFFQLSVLNSYLFLIIFFKYKRSRSKCIRFVLYYYCTYRHQLLYYMAWCNLNGSFCKKKK